MLSFRARSTLVPILAFALTLTLLAIVAPALVRPALVPVSIATLLAGGFGLWIAGTQSRRAGALERAANRVSVGERDAAASEPAGDELGRVERALRRATRDVGARIAVLERERDERERILAHMGDGVVLIDTHDRVVQANQILATILGAALPPAPGTAFSEFARSPELADLLGLARERNQPVEIDLRLWTPQQRRVRATATRLEDAEAGSVILVLHDLTEAELLNQVRQDFVANVSHELKTPLTSVRGYAETLLDGGLEDVTRREEFVRIIRDQAARLENIVDDLLSLAELERPDARLRLLQFDLRDSVLRQVAVIRGRGWHRRARDPRACLACLAGASSSREARSCCHRRRRSARSSRL
jgi:two-component system phosphate regulon sensor histidine kinase PhoR